MDKTKRNKQRKHMLGTLAVCALAVTEFAAVYTIASGNPENKDTGREMPGDIINVEEVVSSKTTDKRPEINLSQETFQQCLAILENLEQD